MLIYIRFFPRFTFNPMIETCRDLGVRVQRLRVPIPVTFDDLAAHPAFQAMHSARRDFGHGHFDAFPVSWCSIPEQRFVPAINADGTQAVTDMNE